MVDADDMRNGWLLRRIFGSKRILGSVDEEDEESAPALHNHDGADDANGRPQGNGNAKSKWGSRGISVSADEFPESGRERLEDQEEGIVDTRDDLDRDAKMKDPDELARILDDDDDGSDDGILPAEGSSNVGSGAEWREGRK